MTPVARGRVMSSCLFLTTTMIYLCTFLESKKTKLKLKKAFESMQYESAKIHINTLSPYVGFGGGRYLMTAVKRMTVKADFLKMPSKDRNCEVESYEDCKTKKLLELCNCVLWEVSDEQVKKY